MKIKTKIPFNIAELQNIQQNGAIVNALDINFQHINSNKQIDTTLIYIQNTKTDVTFVFNQNSFFQKQQFLIKYMTLHYIFNSAQFIDTWLTILFYLENKQIIFKQNILSNDQILLFLNRNKALCQNLLTVILSLPYFYIKALQRQKCIYNYLQKDEQTFFNNNIIYFLKYQQIIDLYDIDLTLYKSKDYIKIFNIYNIDLFNAISQNEIFGCIIYGMLNNKQLINKLLNKLI